MLPNWIEMVVINCLITNSYTFYYKVINLFNKHFILNFSNDNLTKYIKFAHFQVKIRKKHNDNPNRCKILGLNTIEKYFFKPIQKKTFLEIEWPIPILVFKTKILSKVLPFECMNNI